MGLYADKESSKSGCHFLFIIYTNAISHETTIQGMTTFLLWFWLYRSITATSTVSSRAASCWFPKKFFIKLKTRSAEAELGCTRSTFFTAEDQLGKVASFLDHQSSFSSSVSKA
ncbi:hypothetical protein OS493_022405, partial [Desmophyllum pertusum]